MTSASTTDAQRDGMRRCGIPRWERVEPDRREIGRGLFVHGPVGTGKPELACSVAAGWFLGHSYEAGGFVNCRPGLRFLSAPALMRAIRDSYGSPRTEGEVIDSLTGEGLLVIDDLGKEQATAWAVARLWEIVDRMTDLPGRQLVVTSQHRKSELAARMAGADGAETARAIASRLCLLGDVETSGADRRLAR